METVNKCPSESSTGLTCDKEDAWSAHQSLTHRNIAAQRDWAISPQDRVRWGLVGPKKTKVEEVNTDLVEGTEDGEVDQDSGQQD